MLLVQISCRWRQLHPSGVRLSLHTVAYPPMHAQHAVSDHVCKSGLQTTGFAMPCDIWLSCKPKSCIMFARLVAYSQQRHLWNSIHTPLSHGLHLLPESTNFLQHRERKEVDNCLLQQLNTKQRKIVRPTSLPLGVGNKRRNARKERDDKRVPKKWLKSQSAVGRNKHMKLIC